MNTVKVRRSILMPLIGLIFILATFTSPILTSTAFAEPTGNNSQPQTNNQSNNQNRNNTNNTNNNPSNTSNNSNNNSNNNNTTNNNSSTNNNNSSNNSNQANNPSQNQSSETQTDTNTNNDPNTDNNTSCTDQVGTIGWLVCPATGFLANAIDALYGAIEELLVVEPLSTNTDAPVFVIWNYARNISNIIFVILLLVVILSQITGLGISNYGIKRTLPRIIIAAVLVNLSYIFATIAVDISNILGVSLRSFLASVGETAISSGAVNPEVNFSVGDLFAAVAGGGTILGISVAAAGGFSALLALLIPVIIGCVISVAVGLLTISLRQAVITLLIMISPLAFVAYLLPNTEKWFEKWFKIFMQMIIFYPMFSLLFGASRLAGWVLITSADNGLGIILGIAVQIFPLFLGVSLMKMSGTVLGSVSGFLAGVGARATNASRGYADAVRQEKRLKYLSGTPKKFNIPRRVARGIDNRQLRRIHSVAELSKLREERGRAFTEQSYFKSNGEVSRRGLQHADNIAETMKYQRVTTRVENNFDEGLAQFSQPGTRQYKRAERADTAMMVASDRLKHEQVRTADINLENLKGYERRVNEAITANSRKNLGQNYDPNAYKHYKELLDVAGNRGEDGVNTLFANALAQRARADREIKGDYELLLQEAAYTANIDDMLSSAIRIKNPNIMSAAIETMMTRGDTDLIGEALVQFSNEISGDTPADLIMQKRLSDTMVKYKGESAILWGYSKCLNVARGRAEGIRRQNRKIEEANNALIAAGRASEVQPLLEEMPDFFTFEDYLRTDGGGDASKWGVDIQSVLKTADESIGGTQDRTAWSFAKDRGELYYTETQRRNALFGGVQVTGEKLLSLIDMHLGKDASWNYRENGESVSDKAKRNVLTFSDANALAVAQNNIRAMMKGNNASHFTKFKSDILTAFGAVMSIDANQIQDANAPIVIDLRHGKNDTIRAGLQAMVNDNTIDGGKISADLRRLAERGALNGMNTATRSMLNSVLHFDD